MRFYIILLFSFFIVLNASSQSWRLKPANSRLEFNITNVGVTKVNGTFRNYSLDMASKKEDFTDVDIRLTIDVTSIDTKNKKRDEHLLTDDFFDAEKFPTIIFQSKSFTKIADIYTLKGDLSMHGEIKPVELTVQLVSTKKTSPITSLLTFEVKGALERSDFNIGKGIMSAAIGDEVRIEGIIEVEKY